MQILLILIWGVILAYIICLIADIIKWNILTRHGKCRKCSGIYKEFAHDYYGGCSYKCNRCGRTIWLSVYQPKLIETRTFLIDITDQSENTDEYVSNLIKKMKQISYIQGEIKMDKIVVNDQKTWYKSKTLWVNIIGLIVITVQLITGKTFVLPELAQTGILLLINIILRIITKEEIIWKKKK